ncbi:APC family permease [Sciscionella marina]|uniref:APC family permease n=1 Tax=Sciscionella marina TaxID=508770 RepID=UPI00035F1B0D|nr:APC family permease [Sciscionella marina]
MAQRSTLKRSLGLWAIVALGLGYMTPTTVFDTFGIVSGDTFGVVPTAYLVALVVMLFTALSYGKMVRVFSSAGSAYTYTRRTMHPALGFLVGWSALLDYLLLPLVNAVLIRIYLVSLFPSVPSWIWVLAYVGCVTGVNVWSMRSTSRLNTVLVVFASVLIVVFLVLTAKELLAGMGEGTLVSAQPLWHQGVTTPAVLAGTTVVAFSFIGFDAVTMYSEEAKDQRVMPRAILLTVLIGGVIFFLGAWFTQLAFPNGTHFANSDDTLPEIGFLVGGKVFQILFIACAFAATVASGLASHASVSRLLHVMGRNGVLAPKRLFGYIHPKFRTPLFPVLLTGAVSLLAIGPSLELVSSMINFGALIAFTFVNLSVIAHYVVRQRRYKTAPDLFRYLVLPLIGAALTGILWYFLHADALIAGLVWCGIGVIYLAVLTRGFRRPVGSLGIEEAEDEDAAPVSSGTPAPH